jgi:hypothetical protein
MRGVEKNMIGKFGMRMITPAALAVLLLAGQGLVVAEAAAPVKVLGKGPDGWAFTATDEGKGVINCRATRRKGGREDIVAMRNNGDSYLSVRAEGRNGKYPESIVTPLNEPSNGQEWTLLVAANGKRMWFTLAPAGIDVLIASGGFQIYLGNSEDQDTANLGKYASQAWEKVRECVVENGG